MPDGDALRWELGRADPRVGHPRFIEFCNRLVTVLLIFAVGWAIIAPPPEAVGSLADRLSWSMFWLVVANAVSAGSR